MGDVVVPNIRRGPAGADHERGAVLPLVALSLVFLLVAVAIIVGVADRATRRARAQSAADASALAGVADGRGAAVRFAALNGAELVSYEPGSNEVVVVVDFDGVRATAHAERRLALDPRE